MRPRDLTATAVGLAVLAGSSGLAGGGAVLAALRGASPGLVSLVAGAILAWLCPLGLALRPVLGAVGSDVSVVDAVLDDASAARPSLSDSRGA